MSGLCSQGERAALAAAALFRGVRDIDTLLAGRGEVRAYRRGEMILTRTVQTRALGIVLSGQAVVIGADGVMLNRLSPSAIFGVAGVFSDTPGYVKDIVAGRDTSVFLLDAAELAAILEKHPPVARNYIAFLTDRIIFLNEKIDSFTTSDIETRLLEYLRREASGDPPTLTIRSVSELARVLHIGRASLYRALDTLENRGVMRRQGKNITLTRIVVRK